MRSRIMTWNVEQFEILQHKDHPELKQEMLDLINSLPARYYVFPGNGCRCRKKGDQ